MRVLLIEDDEEWARTIQDELADHSFVHCVSRDSALSIVEAGEFFDVVVCDLRLPPADGELGADVTHGQAVVASSRASMPGTPVVVFSAFGDDTVLPGLLNDAPNGDPFGTGIEHGMVRYVKKGRILDCVAVLRDISLELQNLEGVTLSRGTTQLVLSPKEERALRLLGRLRQGRVVKLAPLTGGLSGSRTLRIRVEDNAGARVFGAIAKLGSVPDLHREYVAAAQIGGNMPAAAFAPVVDFVRDGASDIGSLCYSVADGYDRTLFEYIASDPGNGQSVVDQLRTVTQAMREGAAAAPITVQELRDLMFPNIEAGGFPAEVVAGMTQSDGVVIQARLCIQHGDFHGANILLDADGRPIVIDHARAGRHSITLDALTLEMGFVFHPAAANLVGEWPSEDQASQWDDLDRWLAGCPVADLVRRCREWAFDSAASDEEVFATVAAIALRNLAYERPDVARLMALRAFALLAP